MELLGSYNSSLTAAYYQELLDLLDKAISSGDLSGGSAFDKSSLLKLESQAQSFASLPLGSAGNRVMDDSFNYPLSLLEARLKALAAEAGNFTAISGRLLDILRNETSLIDEILAADELARWEATLPRLSGAWSTGWSFRIGQGLKSFTLAPTDPVTGVEYASDLRFGQVFNCTAKSLRDGLLPPATPRDFALQSVRWNTAAAGEKQSLIGPDQSWAQLDLLADLPLVDFSAAPQVQVVFPQGSSVAGLIDVQGNVAGGVIPTYVRLLFYPRRNQLLGQTVSNNVVLPLSAYAIDPNNVTVISSDGKRIYNGSVDYFADPAGTLTPNAIGTGVQVDIYFTEYWPAYQCSTDQKSWSPVIMLDPDRPYPDDVTFYVPLTIQNEYFPLMDETGAASGLSMRLLGHLANGYMLLVSTPAGSNSGPAAVLELNIAQPGYLNSIRLAPCAEFPAYVTRIEVEGLTTDTRHDEYVGKFLLDRETVFEFPRQIVAKIYVTLLQEN